MIIAPIQGTGVLFFLVLVAPPILIVSTAATYVSTNPGGGGAFNSPTICSQYYWIVGSDLGGLYISRNKGQSWYPIGSENGGLRASHVSSIACTTASTSMTARQHLIVGTDDGIFQGDSLDGFNLKHVSPGGYVAALVVSDGDPSVVYAIKHPTYDSAVPQVFRSSNAGQTFERRSGAGLLKLSTTSSSFRVVGMRSHPVDADAVWAISGEGRFATTNPAAAYISTDGGSSFFRLDPQRGQVIDLAYAWDPTNLNKMYLTTIEDGTGHVFMSPDTGFGQWIELTDGPTGIILPDKNNHNHVRLIDFNYRSFTSETLMWESFNGGASWTRFSNTVVGGWSQSDEDWGMGSSFQGNLQTIGYQPDTPEQILWSNPQFIYASENGGREWHDVVSEEIANERFLSRGIDNVVPIVIEPSKVNENLVYAGYMDLGIWRSDDGGKSWKNLNPSAQWTHAWGGKGGNTLSIVADPARVNVVWAQVAGDLSDPLHLLKSNNRGDTWSELTNGLPSNPTMLESIEIDPTSPVSNRRLYLLANGDVYLSTNDGSRWSLSLTCGDCVGVRYSTSGVFAFGPSGVWYSTSNGVTGSWKAVSLPAQAKSGWTPNLHWLKDSWVYAGPIDMAYSGSNELWLAVQSFNDGGGIYYSSNSGISWAQVYVGPYVRSVAVDPRTKNVVIGSSSALQAGGYSEESKGVVVHANGKTNFGWNVDNENMAWPFCTFVSITKSGSRWIISPGEGIMVKRPPPVAFCFSGLTIVEERTKGRITMKDLELGDKILVGDGKYETVYSFGHRDAASTVEFLQFFPSRLEVTSGHLVFLQNGDAIPASIISVGDILMSGEVVTGIRRVLSQGVYAPFTNSGDLVVNGVTVSCYMGFQDSHVLKLGSRPTSMSFHWLAHTFTFPYRMWCRYNDCQVERYNLDGIAMWVDLPLKFAHWYTSQNGWIMFFVSIPFVVSISVMCLFDILVRHPVECSAFLFFISFSRKWSVRPK